MCIRDRCRPCPMSRYFPSAVIAGDEKNALRSRFSNLSIFQICVPSAALTQKIDPRYLSADVKTSVADAPHTRSPTTTGEDRYIVSSSGSVSYTHLRAHETPEHLVCRLLLEK